MSSIPNRLCALVTGLIVTVSASSLTAEQAEHALPRSAPEQQGVSSAVLLELVNSLDERFDGMHSLMIVRHGNVVAEGWWAPYAAEHNHILYSLSKSFASTAVGVAVAEGKLSVDDVLLEFFPGDAPAEADENLRAMRVRDILTMATGHQDPPSAAPDTVSAESFFSQPVPHLPGTHFAYNTAATFMQSAVVQKVTGQTVLDYLRPRLFEPLGIENPVWDTNFQGISLGGYGLRVRTEDIARFGQLYLQKGQWKGQQLLPAEWVEMATSKQVSNGSDPQSDWNQGYGFQFWRCRHNAYRGDGAFGQYCIVMPEQDMVVAITSGIGDMQSVLNVIWEQLLPACHDGQLPADEAAQRRLRAKLASLEVAPAEGTASSEIAQRVMNRRYVFPSNEQMIESVMLKSSDDGQCVTLAIDRDGKPVEFSAGFQQWITGRASFSAGRLSTFSDEPVAATSAWQDGDTAVVKVCAYETPFHLTFTLRFTDDTLTLDSRTNVAFGSGRRETLVGKLASEREDVSTAGKDGSSKPAGGGTASRGEREVIRLYDGPAPGSEEWAHFEKEIARTVWGGPVVANVVHPSLTVVRPDPAVANGTSVVICPGGGFFLLSINSEGMDVAAELAKKGVTCFVLRYRLVETKTDDPAREVMSSGNIDPIVKPIVPLAMADGLAAIAHIRKHADRYGVDPQRIGIMGFSAGGTVASSVGFNYSAESRPNFVAPIYLTYAWTLKDQGVPADAPPMFILAATDDQLGLASQSVDLYRDWTAASKSAELHLYARGGHGFGMNTQNLPTDGWLNRFVDWLDHQGLLTK